MKRTPKFLENKLFWVGVLYFAEGFPFGIFYDVLPVYFRQLGVDLRDIGFLSLLGLAWTIKFLWAPAIDYYRHHRRWMFAVDIGMSLLLLFIAMQSGFGPPVWIAIALFALLSATNDIAIDGYTVELLKKDELGLANGIRNGMYRVGLLAASGILVVSPYLSWLGTYLFCAGLVLLFGFLCLMAPNEARVAVARQPYFLGQLLLAVLALAIVGLGVDFGLLHLFEQWVPQNRSLTNGMAIVGTVLLVALAAVLILKRRGRRENKISTAPLFGAMTEMLRRPAIVPIIFFVLTYKLGDAAMGPMVKPFWVDAGLSAQEIGLVSGMIGVGLAIGGGIVGGWIVDRIGIFHGLWMLGIFQAVSNLGYVWAASAVPLSPVGTDIPTMHRAIIYFASVSESFTGGLGSVAFLAFLMAIVNKKFAAAEYAILSSLFALTRHIAGFASGFGAHYMGYAPYFLVTFFLSFPAYLLLPWVGKMLTDIDKRSVS